MKKFKKEDFMFVILKMCEYVDTDINDIDLNYPFWFALRYWTYEKQCEFETWLIDHLRKNFRMNKKLAKKESSWFIFQYGWSTSKEQHERILTKDYPEYLNNQDFYINQMVKGC